MIDVEVPVILTREQWVEKTSEEAKAALAYLAMQGEIEDPFKEHFVAYNHKRDLIESVYVLSDLNIDK